MSTYRDDLEAARAREAATPGVVTTRPPPPVPDGIHVAETAEKIVVSWRPGGFDIGPLLFGLMMCAVAPVLYAGMRHEDSFDWFPILFLGAMCLPIGLGMVYAGMGRLLNSVRLVVTRDTIETYAGPWPWPKRETYAVSELRQLFVAKDAKTHLSAQFGSAEVQLFAVPSIYAAHYLEETIETFLGIEDRPMRGEALVPGASPLSP